MSCPVFTFMHEERLASENFVSHSDASWSEMRPVHIVLSAQLRQQLWWLQTVSPGIITVTSRQAERGRGGTVICFSMVIKQIIKFSWVLQKGFSNHGSHSSFNFHQIRAQRCSKIYSNQQNDNSPKWKWRNKSVNFSPLVHRQKEMKDGKCLTYRLYSVGIPQVALCRL